MRHADKLAVCKGLVSSPLALAILLGSLLTACQTGTSAPRSQARSAASDARQASLRALNERPIAAFPLTSAEDAAAADYRVGAGDVLEVAIFQVDDLSRTVRVRPDGTISLPLLGALKVAGQSTGALERTIAARLRASYLKDPHVTILVR